MDCRSSYKEYYSLLIDFNMPVMTASQSLIKPDKFETRYSITKLFDSKIEVTVNYIIRNGIIYIYGEKLGKFVISLQWFPMIGLLFVCYVANVDYEKSLVKTHHYSSMIYHPAIMLVIAFYFCKLIPLT